METTIPGAYDTLACPAPGLRLPSIGDSEDRDGDPRCSAVSEAASEGGDSGAGVWAGRRGRVSTSSRRHRTSVRRKKQDTDGRSL